MDIEKIKEIVEQFFSTSGYQVSNMKIFVPTYLSLNMNKTDEGIDIDFIKNLPSVQTKKLLIPITVQVEGVCLGQTGGSVKLKYFPDFTFTYDFDPSAQNFGAKPNKYSLSAFNESIDKQFPDPERNRIAKLALKYTNEWANIVQRNCEPRSFSRSERKKLREQCKKFVQENMVKSKEIEAKSAVLTFILLYFVLPAVINWVVKKFLDNWFNR